MSATSGLSFYLSEAVSTAPQSLTYGFEVLSVDDLSVVGISTSNQRVILVKDVDFTLNLDTKTVTCASSSWGLLTKISQLGDSGAKIRIYRTTSVLPAIDFKSGAVLSEGDLDTAFKQGLFAAQEMAEDAAAISAGVQAVTENMLETGAVTATKIGANAVTEARILNSAVTNAKIADNAVNAAKIQNGTVGTDELATGCVTSAKIGNDQVTSAQIADNSIGYTEISNASASAVKAAVETEAASSPITPDVLRYSPFAPRCYGSVSLATTTDTTISNTFNVASASANGLERTINFAVALDTADYVVIASIKATGAGYDAPSIVSKSTSGFVIDFNNNAGSGRAIDFVVFGSTLS